MSVPLDLSVQEIEKSVIHAFGWSIIEFEAVLFHKFLITAGPASIMTEEMFRRHLMRMHSKGYISPLNFQGRRAWKKLVINWDADTEGLDIDTSDVPVSEEVAYDKPMVSEKLVTESRSVARDVMETVERGIIAEDGMDRDRTKAALSKHAEQMRKALSDSRDDFLVYVESNLPTIKEKIEQLLETKGEDVLLLSLRIIASR
ncbi:MAG: hypothetical protein RTU30_13905 [Candidatus Thorarchaeota archaeon]